MLGSDFYFGLIRKYVVIFGTLFNDIKIVRVDSTHNETHTIVVPLTYGPREKVLARITDNPDLTKMPQTQLPRMMFEMTSFAYDPARKLGSTKRLTKGSSTDIAYQFTPVPYNFNFDLSIMSKNMDDALRIIEQIIPFFTPEWVVKVTLIDEMDDSRDIAIVLENTNLDDLYTGNFEERRVLTARLGFTLKGFLYGPVRTGASVITMANTNFFDAADFDTAAEAIGSNTRIETISVTPGLTANGEPTSNSSQTIDRSLISPTDDYGFVITANTAP